MILAYLRNFMKILKKNLSKYNTELIKYQKFYVRSLYKSNNAEDINNIKSIFSTNFIIPIKLINKIFIKKNIKYLNLMEIIINY